VARSLVLHAVSLEDQLLLVLSNPTGLESWRMCSMPGVSTFREALPWPVSSALGRKTPRWRLYAPLPHRGGAVLCGADSPGPSTPLGVESH